MKKQTIELSKYTAAYTSIGEGIPVILLHGFFGDAWTLDSIAKGLSDKYCCISLELLGFGDSSKPNIRYLIEHQVDFLQEFVIAKDISEFYLIGYSYGAWMAAAYAITMNDNSISIPHLAGMVLVAPTGIRDDSFVGRYNWLKPLVWQTPLVDLVLSSIAPFAKLMKYQYFETILAARTAISTQPAARSFLIDRLKPEDAVDTVENDIDRITIPTLIIAGEIDGTIPLWHSQTYAEKIPQASLEVILGADHDLVQTHSEEVTRSIINYWK
ncbi:alpha/beta hydrolase [Chamaesiphon sp. VAR_48_metabat_135_sub]|uniref:alpha/beta fold hydrolase n=1 Tax=Chamaesiphon sp. VAR_48_metabat_135_sub TaxID=2964699 RepID=UPI00286CDE5E|nr:alpha/beta hydrolase [Chamaesiphon sp. VAR_48_metabat_135_sub]